MIRKLGTVAAALTGVSVIALLALASPARADIITYNITDPNADLSPYPGPYGSLSVNRTSTTTATITFTSLSNGTNLYYAIDGSSVGVNTNGDATISNITGNSLNQNCPASGCYTAVTNQNVSDFGIFSDVVNAFDGFADRSTTISFDLTGVGTNWMQASQVLANNAQGYLAEMHIAVCSTLTNCTSAAVTGFAGNGPGGRSVDPVPEPASLAMLGSALLGLVFMARNRRVRRTD